MRLGQVINNESELRALLASHSKVTRSKFDFSAKQLKSFYRKFNRHLLVINETPKSWIAVTKNYGTVHISKEYSIINGLFIQYIDTWYLQTFHKADIYQVSQNPVR